MEHLTAEALVEQDGERAEKCRVLHKRYLKEHLGAWGVDFFRSAEKLANHEFYRQMAKLGLVFLGSEVQQLTA
ncbi:MAG TPA: hypothetical protein VGK74_08560 [Symbiobacteriaceae bacterium]|jgi:TorA maturation chaperone TorD